VAEHYLASTPAAGTTAPPVEVVVHVEAAALAAPSADAGGVLDDGTALSFVG
jgi:hypothetical protein